MIGLLAAAAIALGQGSGDGRWFVINDPNGKPGHLMYYVPTDRMEHPKESPKKFGAPSIPWEFDWIVSGFAPDPSNLSETRELRFRVYSQEHKQDNDKASMIAQMLLCLWDMDAKKLRIDHNMSMNRGIVDVYVCWGGKPGGEQLLDKEVNGLGQPVTVNTIYIYDLRSFSGPVEMAREVAHEYGHAVLPGINGFETPEEWANGYLGEKIFLRWLRDEITAGRMVPGDAMGATGPQLDAWVKANVDPLVIAAALSAPNKPFLDGKGKPSMDAYIGLALYAESILPPKVFGRSLKLTGSTKASDYVDAIVLAVTEQEKVILQIPPMLKDKPIWVPLGNSKVFGAQVLKKQGAWAQIRPTTGAIAIVPTP